MRGYRIAVVNPLSPFGRGVRQLVDEGALPSIEMKLFDTRPDQGSTLAQFDDEILVTQPLDVDLFPSLDLMFVGEGEVGDLAGPLTSAAREGVLTLLASDLALDAPIATPELNVAQLSADVRLVRLPKAGAVLVGTVIRALAEAFDVDQACATLLVPVSEKGHEGVRELHDQIVQVMSFKPPPTRVLGEQIAFNVSTTRQAERSPPEAADLGRQVAALAGVRPGVASVFVIEAPMFHGYAAAAWIQVAEDPSPQAIGDALEARPELEVHEGPVTPLGVSDSDKIHVSAITPDLARPGAFWLWVVADGKAIDPAVNAVRLAERILGNR